MAADQREPEAYRLAGDRLGKFVILQELGRGAMGVVYEAFQEDLKRKVALKILPANITLDAKQVQRFRREAESAARLRHENIIAIYEVGEIEGTHYFAMERIDGRPFSAVACRDLEEIRAAARVARDAARGLAHAHERGVIHRDVKPGNILVGNDGRVVVTDFGLARLSESASLTSTDAIVGTPKYMPPEQILPAGRPLDGRADVYSLGASLYEVVAGRPPILAPSVQAFITSVLEDPAPSPRKFNRTVPRDLATILLRCLEKDPEDRYSGAAALADDIDRFLRNERIVARPKSLAARGFEHVRRHKFLTAFVAATVVAAGALLVTARVARERNVQAALRAIEGAPDADRAVELAETLVRREPGRRESHEARAVAYAERARARLEAGDFDGALADWERSGRPDPFWRPVALLEAGREEEARAAAEAMPEGDPARAAVLARLALDARDYEDARALLETVPDSRLHAYAQLVLGQAWLGLRRFDAAAEALERANAAADELREGWLVSRIRYWYSEALRASGKTEAAALLRTFRGVTDEALKDLAGFWAGMTRRQESNVESFIRAVVAQAGVPAGMLPAVLKDEAERLLKGAGSDAEAVRANLLLAVALLRGGAYDAAHAALGDALRCADESLAPYALWGLSLLYRAQAAHAEAIDYAVQAVEVAEAIEAFPDLKPLVRNAVVLAEDALERDDAGAARGAAEVLERAAAKRPELSEICAELLRRVRAS